MDHSLDQQISSDSGNGESSSPVLVAAVNNGPAAVDLKSPRPAGTRTLAVRIWVVCGGLLLAVGLVFGQTVGHEFFEIDDNRYVYENPHVSSGLTLSGLRYAVTDALVGEWYPLTSLSHMLDCQLYGLNPAGHHLTSVLVHAASSVLLFLVLLRMTGNLWPSAWVAAVFAIHPLHVSSVAWVAERRELLAGLFFMLTLGAYALYSERPSLSRYLAVAGCLALGLMSKPIVVTVPFLLLLLDYWPLDRFRRAAGAVPQSGPGSWFGRLPVFWWLVIEKIPLLALSAASCGITLLTHGSNPLMGQLDELSPTVRLANALVAYAAYLSQSIYPVNLSPYYPHRGVHLPIAWAVESLALLAAITLVAMFLWRRRPYLLVGWLWFLGMVVPVLGLVGTFLQSRADNYTYLSQIGLSIALAWTVWSVYQSQQSRQAARWRGWLLAVVSGAAVLLLAAVAWRQTSYWRNAETVWTRALACTEQNAAGHYCFALLCLRQERTEEGIAHLRESLATYSISRHVTAEAHVFLADELTKQGKIDEAFTHYDQALRLLPNSEWAHAHLAAALARQGRLDQAIAEWRETVRVAPNSLRARLSLADALFENGKTDEAIASLREALKTDPDSGVVHMRLAIRLAQRDEVDEAIAHFRRAIEIDPDLAFCYYKLAQLLRMQGKTGEAARYHEQGIQASRRYAEAQNLRGTELAREGKTNEAIAQFEIAIAVFPDYAPAHNNLADALASQGNIDGAMAHYRQALAIDPNFSAAKRSLQQLLDR